MAILFMVVIAIAAFGFTSAVCHLRTACNRQPSYWIGILGACVIGLLTTLVTFENVSGNMASIVSGVATVTLVFASVSVIPAMAAVFVYRRKYQRRVALPRQAER